MKRITMILCSLLVAACAGNQPVAEQDTDTAVHCHIEGKVHNRPQSDELWLFVGIDGMVAQSSRPHTIIDIRGSVFSCDRKSYALRTRSGVKEKTPKQFSAREYKHSNRVDSRFLLKRRR